MCASIGELLLGLAVLAAGCLIGQLRLRAAAAVSSKSGGPAPVTRSGFMYGRVFVDRPPSGLRKDDGRIRANFGVRSTIPSRDTPPHHLGVKR